MNAPAPQAIRHVESGEHDSEQLPVHRMSQVAPSLHETLPLAPTVMSHVEPPEQLTLHDWPHVPLHSLSLVHASEQLLPAQLEPSMSHEVPASQAHDVPLHVGGGGASLPHAVTNTRARQGMIDRAMGIEAP